MLVSLAGEYFYHPEVSVGSTPLQKDPSNNPRLDRLLFYAGLAVLIVALPLVLWQMQQGIPILGEERRVLVFTQWWQNELDAAVLPALIREFEVQNPGIRINLDTRPYHEVRRLFLPDSPKVDAGEEAAAALPDILGLDPRWLPSFIERDLLEPIADVPEKNALTGTGEAENALPWALPIVSCVIPLFYRIDILQEAGFDRPPGDQAEFTAMARAVTDPSRGRYGFALSLGPEDPLGVYRDVFPWFRSSGASLLHDGRPAFTETPAANVLSFLNTLSRDGLLAPEAFTKTNKDRLEDFIAGRFAMMLAPAVEIRTLRAAGIPFGVTAIPGPASYIGKPAAGVTGWYAGIPRSGKYKEEAQAFLFFLAGKADAIASKTGMVPGTTVFPGDGVTPETGVVSVPEQDPLYLKVNDIYAAAGTTEEYLSLPAELMLETILYEELYLMFEEGQSPEKTLRAIQQKWEVTL
jgi:multiple sugar transport system substrate-binding protein